MTCPSRHSRALLSKGGAEAGNLAELQDALALSAVGFRVEGVLPTSLLPHHCIHHALAFTLLVSSSFWSPVMTVHENTVLHYLLSENLPVSLIFHTTQMPRASTRAGVSKQRLGCP